MAVETAHHTLFPPQLLLNNQMTMMDTIDKQSNASIYKNHLGYGMVHPLSGTTTAETLLPMYSGFTDSINPDQLKADSGLTYTLPVSRKRSRESSSMCPFNNAQNVNRSPIDRRAGTGETVTFLGEDISSQIQRQQLEIDQFVALHTEKLRADIEERRKKNSRTIMAALEEGIAQRLRAKEEEVMKMAKWNWALEEKLKSLSIENQIWRELAQTNEATANALRSNLKQVLDQVINNDYRHHCSTTAGEEDTTVLVDDAQSCCESNDDQNERMLAEQDSCNSHSNGNMSNRLCKNCGKAESCVLLLPCRHLCLCTVCASSVNICPTCKSTKTISVHVHMS